MSDVYVRTQIKNWITTNFPSEDLVDLTAQYGTVPEFLDQSGVLPDSPWLGIEFLPSEEVPITIGSVTTSGKFREYGGVYIHVVDVAKLGVGDSLLTRGQAIIDALRGSSIGRVVIESMTKMAFDSGATLRFDGGYMSGSFIVTYHCDLDI